MRLILILFVVISFKSTGQTQKNDSTFLSVKSTLLHKKYIYGIDEQGRLNIWNLDTFERSFKSDSLQYYFTSISKDNKDEIFLGTRNGDVLRLNPSDNSFRHRLRLEKGWQIEHIVFNRRNEIFLITTAGVIDPINDMNWYEFEHRSDARLVYTLDSLGKKIHLDRYYSNPDFVYKDNKDIIWMSATFGEWGSVVQLFDSRNRKILDIPDELMISDPKSIFEYKANTFVTSGLHHFMQSGAIIQVRNYKVQNKFESNTLKDATAKVVFPNEVFIGVGNYNSYEDKIYFSTTQGIYKCDFSKKDGISNVELVFAPKLIWKQEPLAIGVDTSIKQLYFRKNGDLILVTESNGIGIYRKGKLTWLK